MIDPNLYAAAKNAGTSSISNAGNGQVSVSIPQYDQNTGKAISPIVQQDYLTNVQQALQTAQQQLQGQQAYVNNLQALIVDATATLAIVSLPAQGAPLT